MWKANFVAVGCDAGVFIKSVVYGANFERNIRLAAMPSCMRVMCIMLINMRVERSE